MVWETHNFCSYATEEFAGNNVKLYFLKYFYHTSVSFLSFFKDLAFLTIQKKCLKDDFNL